MGKTTLLMYRIRILKEFNDQYKCVRSVPPFGFNLPPGTIKIPKKSLLKYSAESPWFCLWRVIFAGLFAISIKQKTTTISSIDNDEKWMEAFGVKKDDHLYWEIIKVLRSWARSPHDECIDRLASLIMSKSPENEYLDRIYFNFIDICGERNSKNKNTPDVWVFYVDGIDESLSDHQGVGSILNKDCYSDYISKSNEIEDEDNVATLAQKLWTNSQVGFAHASIEMSKRTNGQLVVFGSIRSETYSDLQKYISHTESKLENIIIHIKYNDSLLRQIFDYNVDLMDKGDKITPLEEVCTTSQRFCGYKKIPNRAVFGSSEDVYEQIKRHCFDTPRGLVWTGSKVSEIPITDTVWGNRELKRKWRDPNDVISIVNNHAIRVFREYVESLFPLWDSIYEDSFTFIKSNLIHFNDAKKIEVEFSKNIRKPKNGCSTIYMKTGW